MNYRLVLSNLGVMLLLLAGVMGICLGLSYTLHRSVGHSDELALTGWEISMAITAICSFVCMWVGRKTSNALILRKDAIGLVGIGWFVCSVFASLPYIFCEPGLGISEAYFEAASGLTTTGASVFTDLESLPKTIILWRSVTQWLGGMGILAMFVLFAGGLGASGKSVFQTESSMHSHEVVGTTMRQTARRLWRLYLLFTVLCFLGLWALGMTPFQGLNYAMATVSTGGFGTENSSVDGFGSPIRIWIIIFMFVCGISFPLYLVLFRNGGLRKLRQHEEFWVFAGILLAASLVIVGIRALADTSDQPGSSNILDTCFNAVSVATSTGFGVGDYDTWPALAKGILLFLMVLGGCAGSTAGGIKVSRFLLLAKVMRTEIRRVFRPNLVVHQTLNGRSISSGARGQVMVVVVSAVAAAAVGSYLFVALEPDKSVDSCVSAVISCLSNVGPAFGEFGPTHNFSGLSSPSMWLLSGLMILGRLEYVAVLVLLSKQLWRRY